MTAPTQFPAFLSIEYREDGNGFPAFTRAADSAYGQVEARQKRFEASLASAQKVVTAALARPLNELGALDLNVKGLQETARNSELAAQAARELANATRLAATAAGDNSQAARLEIAAMQAVAKENEQAARIARSHAAAMEQVQAQLDKTASAATRLSITGRGMSVAMQSGAVSAGQLRMASIGVGQQVQDIAVSLAGGQKAATVFAQQVPQLAFALSGLEGSTNKALSRIGSFATFLSGPWGAAISIGALALGALATGMGEVDEASKTAQKATDDFKSGLLDVGKFADDTTGRMKNLAAATIRAALAMNSLKQNEAANQLQDFQQKGISAAVDYARSKGNQWHGVLAPTSDSDIGAALRKAGFRSATVGGNYQGNLFTLETELQKAAKTRPELKALADQVSVLAAQSIEAAKGMKSLRENAEFLTGKREIVPGFKPPKVSTGRTATTGAAGAQSGAEVIDFAVARAEALRKAEDAISSDIGKRIDADIAKMGTIADIGDRIAEERARQREIEQAAAEQLLATYREMLGAVEGMGGSIGKIASLAGGLLTGQFSGLGKAGALLNLTTTVAGKDGWRQITGKLDEIFGGKGGDGTFGKKMSAILASAGLGAAASTLVFGNGGSNLGASIGGALGKKVGEKFLSKGLESVAKGLGDFAGPLGSIAGGLLGGAIGGLFKKTKWGAVTVNSSGVSAGSGNNSSAIGAAVQAGGAFNTQLQQIADALGGKIGDFGNITIGQRHGDWRVNTGGTSLKVKKGAVDFNGDGEAAIAYAVNEAIQRGAVTGLRAGTNNLLKASGELQDKLSKALSFENVFRELNKLKDPVGAAISDLNLEYKKLIDIFKQANATVGETAQLEELYNLKRKAAVEDAIKQVAGSLQDLYKNLTIGDNGYSLRTRLNNAKAAYDPLAARVAAGDTTAYNDFAAAAQTIIDLQREYSGSAPEYFAVLDQVTKLTKGEIDRQQAALSSANASASPFDTTPIVDATQQQTRDIVSALGAVNDNATTQTALLKQIQAALAGGTYGRFNF